VRISTNLVQVDAVVTDKKGQLVTSLQPEDFVVSEDGHAQKITNFSYVNLAPQTDAQPVAANTGGAKEAGVAPPLPTVRLRPEQVRRTIALVVDDLGLSFESTAFVRQALKKFVDRQIEEGDLIAIVRTGGGMGALQQFTSDKRQLYAAIERVRWNPNGRGGISAFGNIESDPLSQAQEDNSNNVTGNDSSRGVNSRIAGDELNTFREDLFTVGTLGALNFIVRGLRELPGRKSVVLISDGFKIFNHGTRYENTTGGSRQPNGLANAPQRSDRILDSLQHLTDLANRSSVVIYTMDARGLQTLGLTAADSTSNLSPDQVESRLQDRRDENFDSQAGLIYLAQQTGGFSIRNNNDLAGGIQRVLNDQRGYYLIGYRPDEATFDARTGQRRFHRLTIKLLNHPELRVRTRTGFYGITDEQAHTTRRTARDQIIAALTSPFGSSGVNLRLTSYFGNDAKNGSFMRSLLFINAGDLTFTTEADGWHQAVFNVIADTFGDNGRVVDEVSRTQTVRARGEAYETLLRNGLVFTLNVPIKKAGAYQLRTALRDTGSERVGSASQFIEVPDINKNRLTLSGIVVQGIDAAAKRKTGNQEPNTAAAQASNPASANPAAASGAIPGNSNGNHTESAGQKIVDEAEMTDPQASPAIRHLRRGMYLHYGYLIYNARLDKTMQQPQPQTQIRLFREGRQVFAGKVQPLDMNGQTDPKRLIASGLLQLGTDMLPGEYVLQVVVTDPLADNKHGIATQWIDFDIVN
jgi:VWFA-related protein